MWNHRSLLVTIGMAEAVINMNDVALHFDFHKTTASIIINCFGQTSLDGAPPPARLGRPKKKKLTLLEERFTHIRSRRDRFLPATPLYWTTRNCLCTWVSTENRQELSSMHTEDSQNIDTLAFSEHFWHVPRSIQMKSCDKACEIWYWVKFYQNLIKFV